MNTFSRIATYGLIAALGLSGCVFDRGRGQPYGHDERGARSEARRDDTGHRDDWRCEGRGRDDSDARGNDHCRDRPR